MLIITWASISNVVSLTNWRACPTAETSHRIPDVQEATISNAQARDHGASTETADQNESILSPHGQEGEGKDERLPDGSTTVSMTGTAGDIPDLGVASQPFDAGIPEANTSNTARAHSRPSDPAVTADSHEDKEDIAMRDAGDSVDENADVDSSDDYEPIGTALAADTDVDIGYVPDDSADIVNASTSLEENVSLASHGPSFAGLSGQQATTDSGKVENASPGSSFVPYESPLQYFHAYRFHPFFNRTVSGGLRSLTYSNKIDLKMEVCPDQLAGLLCPRGLECDYQHFESMQAPGKCLWP